MWSVLYQATLEAYLEGGNDAVPADYACGAAEGAQTISALGPACAEGTAEKVEEVWAVLADGSLKVFDTSKFTVGGETVDSYQVDLSITGLRQRRSDLPGPGGGRHLRRRVPGVRLPLRALLRSAYRRNYRAELIETGKRLNRGAAVCGPPDSSNRRCRTILFYISGLLC